ncbi:MAG: hypothetical protein ACRDTG_26585 [Pseudonocardiaceae bacterium]
MASFDLEDLSAVELTATQVQAWVDKKYEARVIIEQRGPVLLA